MHEALEFVKLALRPRYSLAFAVTAILLLAVPLPDFLSLGSFRKEYGKWLGVVAVFSSVVWMIEAVVVTGEIGIARYRKRRERLDKLSQLDSLSSEELLLFGRAVCLGQQTIKWQPGSAAVQSLIHKGLLQAADASPGDPYKSRPYTIPRFVWNYIRRPRVRIKARALDANPDKQNLLGAKEE